MLPPTTQNYDESRHLHQPGQDTLLIDAMGLARVLDRSLTAIRRDDMAGRIPKPITLGGSKKWRVTEIKDWVQAGCPKRSSWETTYRLSGSKKAR